MIGISRRIATVALWLFAAAPAGAGGEAIVRVRADPATQVLGTGSRAAIEIDAATDRLPTVTASAGRVDNLRSLGGGRFAADWIPPREAYPHVAIVAAVTGDRCGWTSIPLIGHGLAIARSAPRSSIRVTIGTTVFGPVVADAGGEARVPVVVSPGVRFAYQHGKALDLKIPDTLHVHLALGAAEASAHASHEVAIWALAVTPEGVPRAGAPIRVAVTAGEVGALAEIAPGTFAGTWRLPPGRAADETATAHLVDEPGPVSTATLSRRAGPPARLAVESGRARVVAGEDGPVPLRVTATDAAGNAVAAEVQLATSFGRISALASAGPGTWTAELSVPAEVGVGRRAEVVARAAGLEDRVDVEVSPGAPERLVVTPASATLVAGGGSEAELRVRLLDRFGNPVQEPAPRVASTSAAATLSSRPDPEGGWLIRYRPGRTQERGTDVLTFRAASLEGTARIELVAPERRVEVAPKLGFAASAAGLRSPYVGAEGAYRPSLLAGHVRLALELGTFVHDRTDEVAVGDASLAVHGRARYVTAVAWAGWHEAFGAGWASWASAGVGMSHVASDVSAAGEPTTSGSAVVGAAQGAVALGRKLGRGMPFAEFRVGWHSDPRLEALRGSLTAFTLSAGYLYDAY